MIVLNFPRGDTRAKILAASKIYIGYYFDVNFPWFK